MMEVHLKGAERQVSQFANNLLHNIRQKTEANKIQDKIRSRLMDSFKKFNEHTKKNTLLGAGKDVLALGMSKPEKDAIINGDELSDASGIRLDAKSIQASDTSSESDEANFLNSKKTSTIKSTQRTSVRYSLGTDRYSKYVKNHHEGRPTNAHDALVRGRK